MQSGRLTGARNYPGALASFVSSKCPVCFGGARTKSSKQDLGGSVSALRLPAPRNTGESPSFTVCRPFLYLLVHLHAQRLLPDVKSIPARWFKRILAARCTLARIRWAARNCLRRCSHSAARSCAGHSTSRRAIVSSTAQTPAASHSVPAVEPLVFLPHPPGLGDVAVHIAV